MYTEAKAPACPVSADEFEAALDKRLMAKPCDPHNVRLLDGPFRRAMEKNAEYLLQLDPDRLLNPFRISAGLEPKAEAYGGWERQTIAGHSLGHYLSACARQYAADGDIRFLSRVDDIVEELRVCQGARKDGYVGGVPEGDRVFSEIRKGEVRSQGFDLNGIWVPWYNLHKLFAGLTDAYELCGNATALDVATKLADWAIDVTASLNDELWQRMLACEHGGMNEALANLHALTGQPEYLELALKFNHRAVLDPLVDGPDVLPGLHGNTQIPKVIGTAREYEITGYDPLRRLSVNFWEGVVHGHTYANGGNTSNEYFGPAGVLSGRLTMSTAETCNTYNMLKLTEHLFSWDPKAEYADYYETALFNHILASQDPGTGMMCYFLSLYPGHFKTFSTPFDSFWCCVGTGMENHARYGEFIYFEDDEGLIVNLFLPSEVRSDERGVKLTQETGFPSESSTKIAVTCEKPTEWTLKIRCPGWAAAQVTARVAGQAYEGKPGTYLAIKRTWADGDVVEVQIPQALRLIQMPDNPKRVAIAYGPVVLAGDLGSEGMDEPAPYSENQGEFFGVPTPVVPVFVCDDRPVDQWITREPGPGLRFRTVEVGRPADVELIPLHEANHLRYSVYWDLFDEPSWEIREREYRAEQERERVLAAATFDSIELGEMQPEREHGLKGEKTHPQAHDGTKMRIAWHGGWFSFNLKCLAHEPVDLVCSYWGADGRNRIFDVIVDETTVARANFTVGDHNRFFDVVYPLPDDLTRGKSDLLVKFQAVDGKLVGPVVCCRIVRRA
jgi:hypothetical protein